MSETPIVQPALCESASLSPRNGERLPASQKSTECLFGKLKVSSIILGLAYYEPLPWNVTGLRLRLSELWCQHQFSSVQCEFKVLNHYLGCPLSQAFNSLQALHDLSRRQQLLNHSSLVESWKSGCCIILTLATWLTALVLLSIVAGCPGNLSTAASSSGNLLMPGGGSSGKRKYSGLSKEGFLPPSSPISFQCWPGAVQILFWKHWNQFC